MTIQENVSLKPFNTFSVEAKAKYFALSNNEEELLAVLNQYKNLHRENPQKLPLLFLGGGSNILLTKDFDGLVIKLNLKGISEEMMSEDEVLVTAKAGENWHQFVLYCLDKNYGGLENLSLIPGNVGTSPMQNIGAYGTEIKDTFVGCKVLDLESLQIENFDKEQCRFGYRDSIFKQEGKGKYVILEVTFALTTKKHKIKTDYGAIKAELEKMGVENPTIQDVSKAVITIRQSKLPDPAVNGNAGSFFKNPTTPHEEFEALQKKFPDIHFYPTGEMVKIPAGWLIENCGWKGKQIGNVASHHLQALVIVNKTGNATGKEIFDFSAMIIDSVKEKFGIELEREVNII
ncbi:UDP-N-acetylmuramate dehydrogenase [Chryseobacterium taklimakanense]|uniref:UDP-N-acetylenolpyruvoylglucosamine reductase n=1 Tax=Chryseobacterium taklimakanense TaxID=536441 RepID=A0A3G8WKD6_9FLAO|nr:UDP-N-acetylmuramate dehydrogenase [Chryseobacterium taklimakanense]AZI21059.1 UDP-N-acetylmuramate dehydrogenase [Chryseobacterium taklimakanense]